MIPPASVSAADKMLNSALWLAQLLLAFVFGSAGFMKATTPIAALAGILPWTSALPELMVRVIGTCELLGAIGMILPSITRIRPQLTPLAALGLATIMLLASGFHLTRGEGAYVPSLLAIGAIALVVAWGRWKRLPIAPR